MKMYEEGNVSRPIGDLNMANKFRNKFINHFAADTGTLMLALPVIAGAMLSLTMSKNINITLTAGYPGGGRLFEDW